jgi:GTPase SAR1 family protein
MNEYTLGPNGGLIFCMEYLEKNLDWLFSKLEALSGMTANSIHVRRLRIAHFFDPSSGHYLIFDCPGQVELYTHHDSMSNIVSQLQKRGYRVRDSPFRLSFPPLSSAPISDCVRAPRGQFLLLFTKQLYRCSSRLFVNDATTRASTCQCALQD